MKLNLLQTITGINKQPIKDQDGDLNLKRALLIALIQPNPESRGASPEDAIKVRKLFDKIDSCEGEIELKSEEVVFLKKIAARSLSEIVAGAICLALEPE